MFIAYILCRSGSNAYHCLFLFLPLSYPMEYMCKPGPAIGKDGVAGMSTYSIFVILIDRRPVCMHALPPNSLLHSTASLTASDALIMTGCFVCDTMRRRLLSLVKVEVNRYSWRNYRKDIPRCEILFYSTVSFGAKCVDEVFYGLILDICIQKKLLCIMPI